MKVLEECVGKGIGDVASIQLHHEEPKNNQWHDDEVGSTWSIAIDEGGTFVSRKLPL